MVYVGEDNTKYRFKSISRDIFGNVESKGDYDWELAVDLPTPSSFSVELMQNTISQVIPMYCLTGIVQVKIQLSSTLKYFILILLHHI